MRVLKFLLICLMVIVVALAAIASISYTPPIFKPHAIAKLTAIDVNNDRQFLLIRGEDRSNPVLLFLHGGPGMPAMYLAHDFQRDLEKEFVVVQWDQRASGKSYRDDIDPSTLKISQMLSDIEVVIKYLQSELGVEKVWLVGHSHGSYLGVLFARWHPDMVEALVTIGQVTDSERARKLQDSFLRSQFASLNLPADTEITPANREDLLFKTHSELYKADSFMPLIISGLFAPEYNLLDVFKVPKGSVFSSEHMQYDIGGGDIMRDETIFQVPVIMMMGKHDMTTPTTLAEEYYQKITAPYKKWMLFDQSAHFPFFEEPEKFTREMTALKMDPKLSDFNALDQP